MTIQNELKQSEKLKSGESPGNRRAEHLFIVSLAQIPGRDLEVFLGRELPVEAQGLDRVSLDGLNANPGNIAKTGVDGGTDPMRFKIEGKLGIEFMPEPESEFFRSIVLQFSFQVVLGFHPDKVAPQSVLGIKVFLNLLIQVH